MLIALALMGCYQIEWNEGSTEVTQEGAQAIELLPLKPNFWNETPLVVNCKGESLASLSLVQEVWTSFEEKGEGVLGYLELECEDECNRVHGAISVSYKSCAFENSKSYSTARGRTHLEYYDDGSIKLAVVEMKELSKLLLKHEAGHSFGWTDASQSNHLMNTNLALMGTSMEGMY